MIRCGHILIRADKCNIMIAHESFAVKIAQEAMRKKVAARDGGLAQRVPAERLVA